MDLMDMARLTDTLPARRALVAVEPALVDWGDALTPAVAAALPETLDRVRILVTRWSHGAVT
jgi:hydrogenase maturation protease